MNIYKQLSRSQWVVSATLLVVLVGVLWAIIWLLIGYGSYEREIQTIEPRLARLTGLLQIEEQLRESELRAASEVGSLVYSEAEDVGSLSAQMQKSARELFTQAGMSVTGTQILSPKQGEAFTRIGIGINASGDIQALEAALMQVIEARPLLFVDRLDIRPERRRARNAPVTQELQVRIQLVSMKLESQ